MIAKHRTICPTMIQNRNHLLPFSKLRHCNITNITINLTPMFDSHCYLDLFDTFGRLHRLGEKQSPEKSTTGFN